MGFNNKNEPTDRVGTVLVALCMFVSLTALALWFTSEALAPSWADSAPSPAERVYAAG